MEPARSVRESGPASSAAPVPPSDPSGEGRSSSVASLRVLVAAVLTASVALSLVAAYQHAASWASRGVSPEFLFTGAIFVLGPLIALVLAEHATARWRRDLGLGWSGRVLMHWTWVGCLLAIPVVLFTGLAASLVELPRGMFPGLAAATALLCTFLCSLSGTWRGIARAAPANRDAAAGDGAAAAQMRSAVVSTPGSAMGAPLRRVLATVVVVTAGLAWIPVGTFAFFPNAGGAFHWVLHLPESRQPAGIWGFGLIQVFLASGFAVVVSCASRLPPRVVLALLVLPAVLFNAAASHPIMGVLSLLTAVPFAALGAGLRAAAVRWFPAVPWYLAVLPTLALLAPRIDDFRAFFPGTIVSPVVWTAFFGAPLAAGAAVWIVRRLSVRFVRPTEG